MAKLLIVGFGPFPRVPRNPSGVLAARVAASRRFALRGHAAEALVLPTAYQAIGAVLRPALLRERPAAVLMLGVAPRRRVLCVEAQALNRASRLFPDAAGAVSTRLALALERPLRIRSRAPAPALLRALRAARLPARVSLDAGRYLCNAAYFAVLAEAGCEGPLAAFIHVPMPRASSRCDRRPTMSAMALGLTEAALALVAARSGR